MNDDINNNDLIRLSTVAEKTGISVHCIKNYVDQGVIQVCDRTTGRLLLFNEVAIKRLCFIKTARDAGVPLAKTISLLLTDDKGDTEMTNRLLVELNQYILDTRRKVSRFEQNLTTLEQ